MRLKESKQQKEEQKENIGINLWVTQTQATKQHHATQKKIIIHAE